MKRKIFLETEIQNKDFLQIEDEKIEHRIKKVYKLKPGETIFFVGNDLYEGKYALIDHSRMKFKKIDHYKRTLLPPKEINLFLSFIRKENFELILEKAGELGVRKIIPLIAERSSWFTTNITERWKKILYSSLEVSEWGYLPKIENPIKVKDLPQNCLVLEKEGEILNVKSLKSPLNIVIGPEGGFSEIEKEIFKEKKCKFISLGKITLKSETAIFVILSLLNFPIK